MKMIKNIDKLHHFMYAYVIADILVSIIQIELIAYLIVLLIILGKEVYDKYKTNPTGFDYLDIICGIFGVIIQYLINLIPIYR